MNGTSHLPAPADITPLTCLDYPGKAACIFWFRGCNLRCPYCYNPELVVGQGSPGRSDWQAFLEERQGFLDAVVLSGGEAALQPGLAELCRRIKSLDYLVKLDTNGSRPDVLARLLEEGLVDYVALDHKMPKSRTWTLPGGQSLFDAFAQCTTWLRASGIPHEIRTTCHPALLAEEDLLTMAGEVASLGYTGVYYLQFFFHEGETLGKLARPARRYDRARLDVRSPLRLGYRNFPEERYGSTERALVAYVKNG